MFLIRVLFLLYGDEARPLTSAIPSLSSEWRDSTDLGGVSDARYHALMHVELMRSKERAFPALDDPQAIDTLRVWHCQFQSLKPIGALTRLKGLEIASFPDNSFEIFRSLTELTYLRILHMPKVEDISSLSSLSSLRSLSLSTLPSWDSSGKVTIVQSLDALGSLASLRHLELFGVRSSNESLAALERCPSLVSVRLNRFPAEEVDRFRSVVGVTNDRIPDPDF